MARRQLLAHIVVFSPWWWVLTIASTVLAVGTIAVSLADGSYTAVDRIGGVGIGLIIAALAVVLWFQTPALAPIVADTHNRLRPWAVRLGFIVCAAAFLTLFVMFLIHEGELWVFTVITGLMGALFTVAAIWGRTEGHSSLSFGIRHPHADPSARR